MDGVNAACHLAVEGTAYHFDKEYTYLIPRELVGKVLPGSRVRVSFGRGTRLRTAVVLTLLETESPANLKPITELLDAQPLLSSEGVALLRYLREQTFCTYFDALRLLIPAGLEVVFTAFYTPANGAEAPPDSVQTEILTLLKDKGRPMSVRQLGAEPDILEQMVKQGLLERLERGRDKVLDDKVTILRLLPGWEDLKLSPAQRKAADFLAQSDGASLKELCYYTGFTRAVAEGLRKKGGVEFYDQVVSRNPYAGKQAEKNITTLSENQQTAASLLAARLENPGSPALLYGVTGSGKTQVYLELIRQVLELGRGVIVLVPEIALTTQTLESFHARFGGRVAVLHSGLSLGERADEWKRIRAGGADIVVGTRSAVFAPLRDIGLIVIDEEQEHSYKSDKSPRFHASDIARVRCKYHGGLLLLASATPSVESYHAAVNGSWQLVELSSRYGGASLPAVEVVDMSRGENLSDTPQLSLRLREELYQNLERGEQSILLLNRRGHSTLVRCLGCGEVARCPACSVAVTYHTANDALLCHYCGHQQERATCCKTCGSELVRYMGIGTQKLEEILSSVFAGARILRVDMDSTMSKFSHQRLFASFAAGEYDIMVGTQMVAKGLNFPNVTLVGVLGTDQMLYANDFRSFERTFALLTQVVGRSGRGARGGRAIVQTYSPDHPIIELAARQDFPAFFSDEVLSRKLHIYPPFCSMATIGFVGAADLPEQEVHTAAKGFAKQFAVVAAEKYPHLPIRLLGPTAADISKLAGKYRYKLILKCKNCVETRALLREVLEWFYLSVKRVHVFADMCYDGW